VRPPDPGLCGACRHSRVVRSGRGSTFRLCELSRTDPAFPRYPPLPVVVCSGFSPLDAPPGSGEERSPITRTEP
jgi:hypothetical protein